MELVAAKKIQHGQDVEAERAFLETLKETKTITQKEYDNALNKKLDRTQDFEWEAFLKKSGLTSEKLEALEAKKEELKLQIANKIAGLLECPRAKIYSLIPVESETDDMEIEEVEQTNSLKIEATVEPAPKRRGRPPGKKKTDEEKAAEKAAKADEKEMKKVANYLLSVLVDEKNEGLAFKLVKSLRELSEAVEEVYLSKVNEKKD